MTAPAKSDGKARCEDQINLCRRSSHILGKSSAAAKACARYDEMIAAGAVPIVFMDGCDWIVMEEWLFRFLESNDEDQSNDQ